MWIDVVSTADNKAPGCSLNSRGTQRPNEPAGHCADPQIRESTLGACLKIARAHPKARARPNETYKHD